MKITDFEVIKTGEQELIDSINGDLDWDAMDEVFRKEHKLEFGEDVEYKKGDLVVYKGQVAYQLEFEVKVNLSIIIDREGNCLSLSTNDDASQMDTDEEKEIKSGAVSSETTNIHPEKEDKIKKALGSLASIEPIENTADDSAGTMEMNSQERIAFSAEMAAGALSEINNDTKQPD